MAIDRRRRVRAIWAVALGAALGLGGCVMVSPAPVGGHSPPPAAGKGPAAAGWISGEYAKQNLKRATTGAGVGLLAGGSVGYYMDVQESKLREQLEGTGIGVTRKGDELTLTLPGQVAFASDSAELSAAFASVLDRVAAALRKYDKTVIEVAGHTDSTDSREHNQALSEQRAAAVAAHLEKRGILKSRIVTVGAGDAHPVAGNDSAESRAKNRRVELTLAPLAAGGAG